MAIRCQSEYKALGNPLPAQIRMNPRAEGVFEAVSYVQEFVRKYKDRQRFVLMLEAELSNLIDDVSVGTSVDFRFRLTNLRG